MACHNEAIMSSEAKMPGYLSHSQFTTYLDCGWRYYLEKILKIEEEPAYYFAGGTAVHSAADAVDQILIGEGK